MDLHIAPCTKDASNPSEVQKLTELELDWETYAVTPRVIALDLDLALSHAVHSSIGLLHGLSGGEVLSAV